MTDIAASTLARLQNVARTSGRSYQLCLQLFCQEEFLRRLSHSNYVDNFVLKGGLFLYAVTGFSSRVTLDIDFLMRNLPNQCEIIRGILSQIIAVETDYSYIQFEIMDITNISIKKKYPGISASLQACIKNTRTRFNIDFGIGDIVINERKSALYPTQLHDFSSPVVHSYSLESTIAEKLDACLSLLEFSSRMKDYYDIYYLCSHYDFNLKQLSLAIQTTMTNRHHNFTIQQYEHFLKICEIPITQTRWKAFVKKIHEDEVSIFAVFAVLERFLTPLIHNLNAMNLSVSQWGHSEMRWS